MSVLFGLCVLLIVFDLLVMFGSFGFSVLFVFGLCCLFCLFCVLCLFRRFASFGYFGCSMWRDCLG